MATASNQPAGDLQRVLGWLALLWVIAITDVVLQVVFRTLPFAHYAGLYPRSVHGAIGIVTAHFLHAGFVHLASNTVALFILGWLSCSFSRRLTAEAIVYSALIGGTLTWLIASPTAANGQPAVHIGASGVVFGLAGFLLANGVLRKSCFAFLIALVVLVLFGASLYSGLMVHEVHGMPISTEMHAGGLIGGIIAAWRLRRLKA